MLDIKYIRENAEEVKKNCENRNIKCDIDRLLELNSERLMLLLETEKLRKEKNEISKKLGQSPDDKEKLLKIANRIKAGICLSEQKLNKAEKEYSDLLLRIPNMTHPDSPLGRDDSENKEIEVYGKPPKFSAKGGSASGGDFEPKGHEELMKDLDLIDFERAAKVTGAKFYFLKNEAVFLEQALINFVFEKLIKKGFVPFSTPDLAKDEVLSGIGFNPRGEETQVYSIEKMALSLVGTAEITMGGYHMNEIIAEEKLPLKYVAISHCFRTEAGSYGRHSAGLYRVHQFNKVEMFVYSTPEESEKMHAELKNIEVEIFKELGVPFRVVDICTGDLGGPAYRKYDLEAWMTSRNGWGEVTSTSDTTSYQARRLNIKMERKNGRKEFLHMLNGTAVAVSRALIAIIENFQQKDGSVEVPKVLRKWMPDGMKIIKRK